MLLRKLVAALVVANLAAVSIAACSVRQSAEKIEQAVDLKYPEKKDEK